MYTAGGGGNSHTTVAKFQYMPGGQGGGGGWARLTAGEASSISGRNANTTADTALRCSHGFIGHLSRGPLRGDSKIRALCGGSNGADGGDHEERGGRTEERDDVPLHADADVPDLPGESPDRTRTSDDPRDDERHQRE